MGLVDGGICAHYSPSAFPAWEKTHDPRMNTIFKNSRCYSELMSERVAGTISV